MKTKILNIDTGKSKELSVLDSIFGVLPRKDVLNRVVRWQMARKQQETHAVKTRSEGSYSKAKIYKQKGTGKARHGSGSVSQFRGGGMAHGPVIHSHSHNLNKKVRKLGLKSALSDKFKLGKLIILDGSKCDGKTSTLKKKLDEMGVGKTLVISGIGVELNFVKAANNIKNLDLLSYEGINVYDIVKKENLIIIDDALKFVEERLS